MLLFGQILLVQTLVNDWQNDIFICNTFHILVSTIADVMHPSFGMIPQGTTMQVLEINPYQGT